MIIVYDFLLELHYESREIKIIVSKLQYTNVTKPSRMIYKCIYSLCNICFFNFIIIITVYKSNFYVPFLYSQGLARKL